MKYLRYILVLIYFLGVFSNVLCATTTNCEIPGASYQTEIAPASKTTSESIFNKKFATFHITEVSNGANLVAVKKEFIPGFIITNPVLSEETKWLGLLYLKEKTKLAIHSKGAGLSAEKQKFTENPDLVEAWKVLDDAGLDKALRSDPDKLTKVNRYLDNNPTKKDAFIDDLKKTSDPGKFVDRTSWKDDLIQKYGDDNAAFKPRGISKAEVPQNLYNDMLNGYSNDLSPSMKEIFLNKLIKSGKDVPVKRTLNEGDELIKIVPKGKDPGRSPFYIKPSEYNRLKNSSLLEQELGLPLGSHSVDYDVFKATAKQQVEVFESTVAPTIQNGYETVGGATQSLILNTDKWSLTKLETIMPPQ